LRDALVKLLPSLTRQAQPFNASALTHTQSLRGLSPNHVLVLVNGKRRHETANLNISGGLEKGSTGVDLDTIPINAIERVEVLRDGASAQYGSDAIAGVINVILKSADSGGSAAADVGQTGDGDGFTHGGGGNIGLAFGDSGFVNLTAEYREQERTMRSGIDERTGRRDNISMGDPAFHRQSLALNSGFGLGDDIEVYGFGTYTRRKASSAANYRLASVAPTLYPDGFTPRPNSDEDDYAFLAGVRGERLLDAWHWDLSSGYGADRPDIGMTQSVNAAIYRETGNSPRSFDLARYRNSQWTSNLDLGREFELDFLAAPLALSLGAEYRRESYRIDAGDPASYYSGGAESLAGLSPLSEGQWSRHAWASYLDLGTSLTPAWEVDVAVRHEKFSDFGSTSNPKYSFRFQPFRQLVLRGAYSEGFRAPSLYELYNPTFTTYTSANYDDPRLCAGGQPSQGGIANRDCAQQFYNATGGNTDLRPETARNVTLGLVYQPLRDLSVGLDFWWIRIANQIAEFPEAAIFADPQAYAGRIVRKADGSIDHVVTGLANLGKVKTSGVDLSLDYRFPASRYGQFGLDLQGTYVSRYDFQQQIGGQYLDNVGDFQGVGVIARWKHVANATWSRDAWQATLSNRYTSGYNDYDRASHGKVGSWNLWDLAGSYRLSHALGLTLGVKNLFDREPPFSNQTYTFQSGYDPRYTDPYGRILFGRLSYSF
ncbi:MAG: TonB-dependent receptor, partial [Pseudomonas aeruginosa]|nr:TonB-dependent receptor [Pseudomonas aeruginosa]